MIRPAFLGQMSSATFTSGNRATNRNPPFNRIVRLAVAHPASSNQPDSSGYNYSGPSAAVLSSHV